MLNNVRNHEYICLVSFFGRFVKCNLKFTIANPRSHNDIQLPCYIVRLNLLCVYKKIFFYFEHWLLKFDSMTEILFYHWNEPAKNCFICKDTVI